jgi:hypothetical protein
MRSGSRSRWCRPAISMARAPASPAGRLSTPRTSSQGIELWRIRPRCHARSRSTGCCRRRRQTLLPLLASPSFDPLATSYVEGAPPTPAPDAPTRGGPATIVIDGEREVVVEATLDAPGFVVLADTAYPGWRATVDDQSTRILVTNHLFRGVAVPPGRHRVRFVYAPWTVPAGIALSAVGVVTFLALATWGGRKRGSLDAATALRRD